MNTLRCGRFLLPLSRPLIMGIVNVTDNSFSGDGVLDEAAFAHAQAQLEAGADMLDIGGESSRPGARSVSVAAELGRVIPLVRALRDCGVPISVDTTKPEVMRAVLAEGADMINDIGALQAEGAIEIVAKSHAAVCLMHMQGSPLTMQHEPGYHDVVQEVIAFLVNRVDACERGGIKRDRIVLDPGFGFGKTLEHNVELFHQLSALSPINLPFLVGVSRKSMIGQITEKEVAERMPGSVAAAMLAVQKGASIVRVHDVAATKDALKILETLGGS